MIVVPKKRHIEIVGRLEGEIRASEIDLINMTVDRNKYKELYNVCVNEKTEVEKELNLIKKSNEVRQDKLCKLEYTYECAKKQIKRLMSDIEELKNQNENLESKIEFYRTKEAVKDSQEIQRLERLAKRTKKYKVKNKCESRILKIKEKQMNTY